MPLRRLLPMLALLGFIFSKKFEAVHGFSSTNSLSSNRCRMDPIKILASTRAATYSYQESETNNGWKANLMRRCKKARRKLDTWQSSGLETASTNDVAVNTNNRQRPLSTTITCYRRHESKIGVWGHSGLLLLSTVLVMVAKQFWITLQQQRQQSSSKDHATQKQTSGGGMMDRCPWPFIFSHDPIQGLKDPPTWILITWIVLWRVVIASAKVKGAAIP